MTNNYNTGVLVVYGMCPPFTHSCFIETGALPPGPLSTRNLTAILPAVNPQRRQHAVHDALPRCSLVAVYLLN